MKKHPKFNKQIPHIKRAIEIAGSPALLAADAGVCVALTYAWADGSRGVNPGFCPSIERATNRLVTCEQIRPEVEWSFIRNSVKRFDSAPGLIDVAKAYCASDGNQDFRGLMLKALLRAEEEQSEA